jgi:glycosyltransferase 2 family protein
MSILTRANLTRAKLVLGSIKPYLRWVILGATLFFIGSTFHKNWSEVRHLQITAAGWRWLGLGLLVTLLAHCWTGWVWSWILRALGQPASGVWGMGVYLRTNVAKYLPGNVWHLYGRVVAAKQAGISTTVATLSVLLEPLLMAAAALMIALTCGLSQASQWLFQAVCLLLVLAVIHPSLLNPLLKVASRLKGAKGAKQEAKQEASNSPEAAIDRYPFWPLLGEIGFVGLRALGFLLTVWALQPVSLAQLPLLISAFSLAWVLGLVIPGAPGGIGVFEATAIALLNQQFPTVVLLGSVALYRVISLLAEVGGAGLAIGLGFLQK